MGCLSPDAGAWVVFSGCWFKMQTIRIRSVIRAFQRGTPFPGIWTIAEEVSVSEEGARASLPNFDGAIPPPVKYRWRLAVATRRVSFLLATCILEIPGVWSMACETTIERRIDTGGKAIRPGFHAALSASPGHQRDVFPVIFVPKEGGNSPVSALGKVMRSSDCYDASGA